LGKIETPFFGAPKKRKREKTEKNAILRSAGRRAWGCMWSLSTGLSSWRSPPRLDQPPLAEGVYRLFAAAPLTTSTAPISASLRRVRSSASRHGPTP